MSEDADDDDSVDDGGGGETKPDGESDEEDNEWCSFRGVISALVSGLVLLTVSIAGEGARVRTTGLSLPVRSAHTTADDAGNVDTAAVAVEEENGKGSRSFLS